MVNCILLMKLRLIILMLLLSVVVIDCKNDSHFKHIFEKSKWFCEMLPDEMLQSEMIPSYEKYHIHFYQSDLFTMRCEYRYNENLFEEVTYDGYYIVSQDHSRLDLHLHCPIEKVISVYHIDGELHMEHDGRSLKFRRV